MPVFRTRGIFVSLIIARLLTAEEMILPKRDTEPSRSDDRTFAVEPALKQSLYFVFIQHGFRIATQPGTRSELRGPFFRDWFSSVGNLRGWDDGDPVIANYVAHPMEGAIAGYIQVQNDPRFRRVQFGEEGYWASRWRAFLWSTAYSTQYEIGPISDASIGNVGRQPGTKGVVDLVVTPTLGMSWMVTEDVLDRHVIARIEEKWRNPALRMAVRSWLNPSRSMANVLRGRWPWYRDSRGGIRQ